jgi:hypothetical protein
VRFGNGVTQPYFFRIKADSPGIKITLIANNHVQPHDAKFPVRDSVGAAHREPVATLAVMLHMAVQRQEICLKAPRLPYPEKVLV